MDSLIDPSAYSASPLTLERARPSSMARVITAIVSFGMGGLGCIGLLELAMRGLPVCSGRTIEIDSRTGIRHWQPCAPFVYSDGWMLERPIHGRTNAAGFVSDREFVAGEPAMIVIGDSFIEAEMIEPGRSYPDLLAAKVGNGLCYRVGMARSGLAEYVALARWAVETYRPRALFINIVDGDIAESVARGGLVSGMHYFNERGELVRAGGVGSASNALLKQSVLMRYIAMNLRIDPNPRALAKRLFFGAHGAAGATSADSEAGHITDSFFDHLAADIPLTKQSIVLVVDAERSFCHGLPPDQKQREQREAFIATARQRGYRVADLQEPFESDWRAHAQPLDTYPLDRHWNTRAHQLVADALEEPFATAAR